MAPIPAIPLLINGAPRAVAADPDAPLLWILRDTLNLTGTKYGCGIGQCGACTVHVDDAPVRACLTPVGTVAGKAITTIEGLSRSRSHPLQPTWIALQRAWIAEQVPQCGYCQPGMLMEAAALLAQAPHATDADIDRIMGRHICRCGTYQRIRQAIHRAARGQDAPGTAAASTAGAGKTSASETGGRNVAGSGASGTHATANEGGGAR